MPTSVLLPPAGAAADDDVETAAGDEAADEAADDDDEPPPALVTADEPHADKADSATARTAIAALRDQGLWGRGPG